ncbi:hypothetical protein CBER1_11393 [Cercospora berteroae]|uniref:Uncharacterized protein n=1 Tax=Cercospora berteroae TaxID=357750 RepID=A0A2S6CFT7_9PEZI|nr:hypothetical protein CBER1_11393 [Cercospora berteroae]
MSTDRSERHEQPESQRTKPQTRHAHFATPALPTRTASQDPRGIDVSLKTTRDPHSIEEALNSYSPRQTPFHLLAPTQICDEKVIRHDHSVAQHFESQSQQPRSIENDTHPHKRTVIHHRELVGLNLISNLTRIQYGYWHDEPACLVGFTFQFLGSEHGNRWVRFDRADVTIKFHKTESEAEGQDPEVVDFGPKHLVTGNNGTEEKREWHLSANLPAVTLGAIPVLGLSAGVSRTYEKRYASSVEGASVPSHGHTAPDMVRFWIREDAKQKEGLPLEFDCAAVVTFAAPASFRATVGVKAGAVFDMLAQPWSEAEPVLFQHGVELGEPVGKARMGMIDFAALDVQDWGRMVGAQGMLEAGKR